MTCASCVRRIEKSLVKTPASQRSVNLATEQAHVTFDPAVAGLDDCGPPSRRPATRWTAARRTRRANNAPAAADAATDEHDASGSASWTT